ncbi:hypothetical protein HC248_03085 [Polaromonas vacuolata]|uniref:Transcriptional regulator n=1 Tax=Polaromonas vacuolata TaxID=37448 RepID=A0A6H2HDU8_9BURK|nr:transcriptional regulator [Polaromonas vacuolata]QJC57754.1 hypothetical protein HC248_03085 [Polaromonas vacuolata]
MNEKLEFSDRLRSAILAAGYPPRPSIVVHEFNTRWHGASISTQAAWSWLNNKSIPLQDKIQVLAEWLKVDAQSLRFGDSVRHSVGESGKLWGEGSTYIEREAFDAFLKLPTMQRKTVREVITAFTLAFPHTQDVQPDKNIG